ncbi:SCO family protein [Marinobacterium jannaschii]|uniref:SCO family protein n=1 Tax=Marinobacterium jannaschii TaxID=64970 RepID=UPI000562AA5E|nr:SCO family protein [Marinobacterium jannaschii]
MSGPKLSTLRNLLVLTAFMLIGIAVAFYFRPLPIDSRLAQGDKLGGDFTLQSAEGALSLKDYRGKAVVMYIGYASCPDVCPTALAVLSQALREMEEDEVASIRGLFMSVDPERDTPEKLAKYAAFFHPNIDGATADRSTIDKVVRQYGAFYRIVEMKDSAMGYAVDHSSRLYVINKEGELSSILHHNSSAEELVAELRKII